jgi:hypothetical protein
MATATIPTLKHLFQDFGLAVWDRDLVGEWSDPDYAAAIKRQATAHGIDLNDYLDEVIHAFVQRDIADRAKRQVFIEDEKGLWQPSMFTEDLARQGVIRLGNGARVKMPEATGPHWISHVLQQQKALHRVAEAINRTARWLESTPGILLTNNPTMKTFEAMRQLGFWK